MNEKTLGFIGGGNMSGAIIGGLIDAAVDPGRILISEPSEERRAALEELFPGCQLTSNNALVASNANIVVLGVKPQVLPRICAEIETELQAARPLLVSIAAGVRSADIDRMSGGGLAIVRTMPNQPAMVRRGVTGLYANAACSEEDRDDAQTILSSIGEVVTVSSEDDLDIITAVSGSGPVYYYALIGAMIDYATERGFASETARALAIGTATGSAALAGASDESMDALIANVRSPGGTTAAALDTLEAANVHAIFEKALEASRLRSAELANVAPSRAD